MSWSLLAHTIKTRATTDAIDTTGADLLVVAVSSYSTTPVTVSDSKSNTWSPLTEKASGNNHTRMFYCQGGTVGSAHTFSTNADYYDIAVAAFSGSAATPFDVQNGAAAVASALATGSITPAVDGELIASALGEAADGGTGRTYSVDSSLTITDQNGAAGGNHNGLALAYFAQTTAAAINPTWSITGGANNIAVVIASFKPATGGQTYTQAAGADGAVQGAASAASSADAATQRGLSAGAGVDADIELRQWLRPIADVSAGAWTPSAGVDLYATLDEAVPSDADWDATASASTMEVRLTAAIDPASSANHQVRYRAKGDGGTDLVVALKQGATMIASWTETNVPATETTFEHTLSGAQADAITDYSDLRLSIGAA